MGLEEQLLSDDNNILESNGENPAISGMHKVNPDAHWVSGSLRKDALGILDLPYPQDKMNLLDMSGVPNTNKKVNDNDPAPSFGGESSEILESHPVNKLQNRDKSMKKHLEDLKDQLAELNPKVASQIEKLAQKAVEQPADVMKFPQSTIYGTRPDATIGDSFNESLVDKSKFDLPKRTEVRSNPISARPQRFRFNAVTQEDLNAIKEVQTLIGAVADGKWGPNTDAAWNKKVRSIGLNDSIFTPGDYVEITEPIPTVMHKLKLLLGVATSRSNTPHAPLTTNVNTEQAVNPAEQAVTPTDAAPAATTTEPVAQTPESSKATERIELSLHDARKGTPRIMSYIAKSDARRGVALIEWPEEEDDSKKYDTIIQLDSGKWELGPATRQEMRALRKPFFDNKDVRREIRRERKDLSMAERRELRRQERARRKSNMTDDGVLDQIAAEELLNR